MSLTKIIIESTSLPPKSSTLEEIAEFKGTIRVLIYDSTTKQWTSNDGGLYPREIKLIAAIDKIRQENKM